jgi:probable rRNA maturation factor
MTVRLSAPARQLGLPPVDLPLLRSRARCIMRSLGHARSELSIALVDDDQIAKLNGDWRGRARPTDVLSFSLIEGEQSRYRGKMLGDVVIGIETAARQARQRHRGLDEELSRLLIHGVLHLLGHDHEKDAEARIMRAGERRLSRAIRVAESR